MDVDTDVLRFLKHLESERRLSPRTVVSYRKDLEDLRLFLDDHYGGGGWGWGTVERIDFRAFMGGVGGKDCPVVPWPGSFRPYGPFTGSFISRIECRVIRPGR